MLLGYPLAPEPKYQSIAYHNIRCMHNKMDQVNLIIGRTKPFDILAFSETWINDMLTDQEIVTPSYSVRWDHDGNAGGGSEQQFIAVIALISLYVKT